MSTRLYEMQYLNIYSQRWSWQKMYTRQPFLPPTIGGAGDIKEGCTNCQVIQSVNTTEALNPKSEKGKLSLQGNENDRFVKRMCLRE